MFSKRKYVKTEFRCSLSKNRLENLLRIFECGPSIEEYDVMPALRRWATDKARRPFQTEHKRYKKRKEAEIKIVSLSDSESDDDSSSTELEKVEDTIFSDNEIKNFLAKTYFLFNIVVLITSHSLSPIIIHFTLRTRFIFSRSSLKRIIGVPFFFKATRQFYDKIIYGDFFSMNNLFHLNSKTPEA